MTRLDELKEHYNEKYGEGWDRTSDLSYDEEVEWIEACYDYYENHCERKETFGGLYSDQDEPWYGYPFEIIEHVEPGDSNWDITSLPIWLIRIIGNLGNDDPGEFAAYPEEIFVDERETLS